MKLAVNIFCISVLFLSLEIQAQFAVLPWKNNSAYYGKWNLSECIPTYTANLSREMFNVDFITPATVLSKNDSITADYFTSGAKPDVEILQAITRQSGAEYAIIGQIENFTLNRYLAGEPIVAGYEHYSCTIECNLQLFSSKLGVIIENFPETATITKNTLGFSLIGKPSEEKIEFYNFDKIAFGGENFEKTLVGETMVEFVKKMHEDIQEIIKMQLKEVKKSEAVPSTPGARLIANEKVILSSGEILLYDQTSEEAFVNLGSNDNIEVNDKLNVFGKGQPLLDPKTGETLGYTDEKIAELIVIEVRGPKLCLAVNKDAAIVLTKGAKVKPVNKKSADKQGNKLK